jgi:hypothetical protein
VGIKTMSALIEEVNTMLEIDKTILKKAQDTGKFTRVEPGLYVFHACCQYYVVRKYEVFEVGGRIYDCCWYKYGGDNELHWFGTLKEAKRNLLNHLDENSIIHSLPFTQYWMLHCTRLGKGEVVYFYDHPYKTPGAKRIAQTLVKKGLINARFNSSSNVVETWITTDCRS